MTKFPVGTRVRNMRTGELATVVEPPRTPFTLISHALSNVERTPLLLLEALYQMSERDEGDSTPTEYDDDPGTVWYTSNSKLEVVR